MTASEPEAVAISVAGCDHGNSGVGVFARAVLPRLFSVLGARGLRGVVVGTYDEQQSLGVLGEKGFRAPAPFNRPLVSAAFSLLALPALAKKMGARVLYLPAAHRRVVLHPSIPTVGTVHDLAQFHLPNGMSLTRRVYFERVLTPLLRQLRLVLAVSQATADDIIRYAHVPPERVRVVPNGVTLSLPSAGPSPRSRPYLLYPARLEHPSKNHLRLLEAFALSQVRFSHELVLCGADGGAGAMIQQAVIRLGLQSNVVLLGFVAREQFSTLLAHASAVIAAGLFEGFGLQAAEGLAAGRPIVCSSTGSLPEVVGDLGVLFDPLDVGDMARALERVVFDETLRKRCRVYGPIRAERFSWDWCVEAIADSICELAQSGP